VPEKITTDKSGANTAATRRVKSEACVDSVNASMQIPRQHHRAIKRITRPILGFKSFWRARIIIAGIETMHMSRKGQMDCFDGKKMSAANQFYSLATRSPTRPRNSFRPEAAIATEPEKLMIHAVREFADF
jgi:putative transposase|tara:strand:- start:159 stop:551 length:393 start_codon:yes stop_codon:yes gene_type:complete